ncbi:similar to ankyrin 2,3/unc44 [Ectocarpus siliculosus]|uniref:Similar to ankyrin 2,3/unc44, partial n=1 Tax=Ectocarpus siliculosus TaxID=2880 RepID=D7FJD5_ECTSI|nr:similar to ankyrin 2,3/unc44 [Ectocarpus siliculosus]|eukprot:CBJ29038.1 similar to ankyrin 2,3/unc44 [Ectocarpus siliculosus]
MTGANINESEPTSGTTALHVASKTGRVDIVQDLIRNDADLDALDLSRWTPLQYAVFNNYPDVARALLDAGCNTAGIKFDFKSREAKDTMKPLLIACKRRSEQVQPEREIVFTPAMAAAPPARAAVEVAPNPPPPPRLSAGSVGSGTSVGEWARRINVDEETLRSRDGMERWMQEGGLQGYTQKFLDEGFSSLFFLVSNVEKQEVATFCKNIGMLPVHQKHFLQRWDDLAVQSPPENAGRGNDPEASAPRGEGKRREETQQRDDAAVADSVRARLLKCKNLAVLDVNTEGGKKVTTLRDKVCQLQEALLDPTYPKAYIKQRLRTWAVSAATVVQDLHRAGVVWGSVRPDTFIVKSGDTPFPVLLATDFSRAAISPNAKGQEKQGVELVPLFSRGEIRGELPHVDHLRYMAPEVSRAMLDGESYITADEAQDIWSLGMLIYGIEAGHEYPFRGLSAAEVQRSGAGNDGVTAACAPPSPKWGSCRRARGSMLALAQRSYITANDTVMLRAQNLDFQPVIEHVKEVKREIEGLRQQFSLAFDALRDDFLVANAASVHALKGEMGHVVGRIDGMAATIGSNRELETGRIDGVREEMQLLAGAVQELSENSQASARPLCEMVDQLDRYNEELARLNSGDEGASAANLREMSTAIQGMQRAMSQRFASIESTLDEHDKKLSAIMWGVSRTANVVDQLITGDARCPKLLLMVPEVNQRWKRGLMPLKPSWCRKERTNMLFLCAYNLHPAHCGPKGKGFTVKTPSRQMQRWTPALKASIMVLKLAAAVTRVVTGLPIPIGVNEMTEGMAFAVLADLEEEYARAAGESSLGGEVGGNIEELFTSLQEEEDQTTSRQVQGARRRVSRTPQQLQAQTKYVVRATGDAYEKVVAFLDEHYSGRSGRRDWRQMLGLQPVAHPLTGDVAWVCDRHRHAYLARAASSSATQATPV